MRNLKYNMSIVLSILLLVLVSCQEDDALIGEIIAPTNVTLTAEIIGIDDMNPNGDGSGFVNIKATASNVISYKFDFGDGLSEVSPSGEVMHRFSIVGVNKFTIVVNAIGTGGLSSSTSVEIEVFSSFDDPEVKQFLSGGSSRTWYLAASEVGHLGVGGTAEIAADAFWFPSFFAAQPFEKCGIEISDCLCDDELTFSLDNGQLTYQLNNNSGTFFNASHQDVIGEDAGEDACFPFDTSGTSIVSLAPTSFDWETVPDPDFRPRGTVMNFSNNAFMGYYVSSSSYEILEISDTELYVRTLDGKNPVLYWYHRFQTSPAEETFESVFNNLVWADEFDTNGAPDSTKWTYDLGAGGWGNQELQTYTNESKNVIIEDGVLKITAIAENGGYTSARLKSENLNEFTYGRVEVRAKLPSAQGTWPAIWMLGANFDVVGWPDCGEIDIMEQTGQDKTKTSGALHFPGNFAGNAITNEISNTSSTTEFHNYAVEWTTDVIKILVDDKVFLTYANTSETPFNLDFFMILNIAMGGTLGGTVDPGFTQDTMEIDYVRVYQ